MVKRRKTPVIVETTEPHLCSTDLRLTILHSVPFFAGLPHEAIAGINQFFHEKGYDAGETIYVAGDPARSLMIIAEGRVKLLRHTSIGKDILLDLLIPGEFFGTLSTAAESEYQDTAVAMTSICALAIEYEKFRSILLEYPAVSMKVLDTVSGRLAAAHATIQRLSSQTAEQRIAATLLRLADKLGEKHEVGLLIQTPLSRDELADMTGATPETASRVISQFQKDGLIETGRQWIAITDSQGLRTLAE